ncbi:hypothetical protein FDI85_gp085 [Erwinia phage Machina]|uniref:Uncharacterized protein n=1 Tax=Erwinia phage Machina TaxID=1883375 RepID=A0A1B2IEW7_9CAUD|nr:hypothetical protein FDI85_gp085 [Erwinia phage Machina]ANZ49837.1 hypothetical protein MACHINA_199 [Erwinia phage Machina]
MMFDVLFTLGCLYLVARSLNWVLKRAKFKGAFDEI